MHFPTFSPKWIMICAAVIGDDKQFYKLTQIKSKRLWFLKLFPQFVWSIRQKEQSPHFEFPAYTIVHQPLTWRDDAKSFIMWPPKGWLEIIFGISLLSPSQHGHPSGINVVDLGCYRSNTPGLAASQLHVDLCVSDRCFAFICGQNSSTGLKKEEKCVMDILSKVKILSCLI